jgi:hypothetical protein
VAADLAVEPLPGLSARICRQVALGKAVKAKQIGACLGQLLFQPARYIDTGNCGHRVTPAHRDLWSELNENHAMAVSHHDATLNNERIEPNTTAVDATARALREGFLRYAAEAG